MQLATPSSRIKTYTKQSRPTELTTHDKYLTYTYDSHGRVLYKTQTPLKDGKPLQQSGNAIVGFRNSLQLAYNADHELTQSISITQQGIDTTVITTDYHYDAFGRHTHKHSETKHKSRRHSSGKLLIKPVQTQMLKIMILLETQLVGVVRFYQMFPKNYKVFNYD